MSELKVKAKIPLTGTVISTEPVVIGDDKDPIRPVEIDLGDVEWRLINLDLDNDIAEIEITPNKRLPKEKRKKELERAISILTQFSKEDLYRISGCHKLKKPKQKIRGVV